MGARTRGDIPDCDRWFYPDATGRFQASALDPGQYTVTAFLEEPSGLTQLASVEAVLLGGQTATVELVVPALPSIPPAQRRHWAVTSRPRDQSGALWCAATTG